MAGYIIGTVTAKTVGMLARTAVDKAKSGSTEFVLLLSTLGGSVSYGVSAFNLIRNLAGTTWTAVNMGTVQSIGVIVYCAAATAALTDMEHGSRSVRTSHARRCS